MSCNQNYYKERLNNVEQNIIQQSSYQAPTHDVRVDDKFDNKDNIKNNDVFVKANNVYTKKDALRQSAIKHVLFQQDKRLTSLYKKLLKTIKNLKRILVYLDYLFEQFILVTSQLVKDVLQYKFIVYVYQFYIDLDQKLLIAIKFYNEINNNLNYYNKNQNCNVNKCIYKIDVIINYSLYFFEVRCQNCNNKIKFVVSCSNTQTQFERNVDFLNNLKIIIKVFVVTFVNIN